MQGRGLGEVDLSQKQNDRSHSGGERGGNHRTIMAQRLNLFDELHHNRNHRKDDKNVNESAEDVEAEPTNHPENE